MPRYRRKYPKRSKRSRTKRRTTIQRSPIVADKQVVRHKYAETFSLDPGLNTSDSYVFSVNGLYDPNITGTGHQPLGFDEWNSFYNHYTVIGSKIRCTFVCNTSSATSSCMVGVDLKAGTTETTDPLSVMEQGKARYRIMSNADGSNSSVTVTHKTGLKSFLGKVHLLGDDECRGSGSANPTEQAYWHVFATGIDSGTNPAAILCMVNIEYIAVWTERKTLTQS